MTRAPLARRAAVVAVLVLAAGAGALRTANAQADTANAQAGTAGAQENPVEAGRRLYETGCSSCHGADGNGVDKRGPTLIGVGAASAYFFLTSGRMPTDDPKRQTQRKPPAYDPEEIDQLVAYVASLGDGPPVPDIDPADGDLAEGQQLYTANCAACHNSAGSGGALGEAVYAPSVTKASPTQVAAAVRIGPGQMPVFESSTLDDEELASVLRYVEYLKDPEDPGGAPLGRVGPVPEGFVAWVFGIGAVLLIARWLGAPTRFPRSAGPTGRDTGGDDA